MNKASFEKLIFSTFGVGADYPFARYPDFAVFRHEESRKWFAVTMTIPKRKLGMLENDDIDVVNLKCGDEIISSMLQEKGVYNAYHMTKGKWVSVALNGECDDETVEFLLKVSYELTKSKK